MSAGKKWTGLYSALEGGVGGLTDHYDKEVDKYMEMSQQEMERYPEYVQAKKEGKSEEQARFRAADPRAKRGALISLFTGVIKGMMKHGVSHLTGSAADGIVTRYVQDFLGGRAVDGTVNNVNDQLRNYFNNKDNDKINNSDKRY